MPIRPSTHEGPNDATPTTRDEFASRVRPRFRQVFGHQRRRTLTPEELGHLLAAGRPFYRDHFLIQAGTGLRSGELLGLRRRRVFPELARIEVIEVRYEPAGSVAASRPSPRAWPACGCCPCATGSARRSAASSPDDRLGVAERVAAHLLRERQDSRAVDGGEGR
jgi:hypothetical protein